MRLICPNCGAQYEVPDEVIPESGRDVQCSDCGDTWFQHHPNFAPELDSRDEAADATPDWDEVAAPPPPPEPDPEPAMDPDPERDARFDEVEDTDPEDDEAPDEVAAETAAGAPTRRELDPSIRDLLREEADREEKARQSEMGGGLETQQDLGIEEVDSEAERRSQEARARMARLRGLPETDPEEADEDAYHDIDPGSRRNLLPDIEEINSSLGPERVEQQKQRAVAERESGEPLEPPEKSAFRKGFRISILLAVAALLIYVFAPQIVQGVPALTDPVAGYVDLINSGRLALAEMVQDLAASLGEEG